MPLDPNEELTGTLTAAEWNAVAPYIFDLAFQAKMKLNVQLQAQQAQKEKDGPRVVPNTASD
jgi:hypothetical protein